MKKHYLLTVFFSLIFIYPCFAQNIGVSILPLNETNTFCSQEINEVQLKIRNEGKIGITKCDILWRINGVEQTSYTWEGSLLREEESELLTIGAYETGKLEDHFEFELVLDEDEDLPDITYDEVVKLPLNGQYTVGNLDADFAEPAKAIDFLNTHGICGATVLNFMPGTYKVNIELGAIQGATKDHTLTLQSIDENPESVQLIQDDYEAPILSLRGDYIHIRHLTLEGVEENKPRKLIIVENQVRNIVFEGNKIIAKEDVDLVDVSTKCEDIQFVDNEFWYGNAALNIRNVTSDIIIEQNQFFNQKSQCIGVINSIEPNEEGESENVIIRYNELYPKHEAFLLNGAILVAKYNKDVFIEYNLIEGAFQYGIWLNACKMPEENPALITNNILVNEYDGELPVAAVREVPDHGGALVMTFIENVGMYHNTVISRATKPSNLSTLMVIESWDFDFKNNLLVQETAQDPLMILTDKLFPHNNISMDYNNYQIAEQSLLASSLSKDILTGDRNVIAKDLTAWKEKTELEQHSLSVPVVFDPDRIGHVLEGEIAGKATPLPNVLFDFDLEPRDALYPDIGADEFDFTDDNPDDDNPDDDNPDDDNPDDDNPDDDNPDDDNPDDDNPDDGNAVGIVESEDLVDAVLECYPNPASAYTQVNYHLPSNGFVEVSIYHLDGQLMMKKVLGMIQSGEHSYLLSVEGWAEGMYQIVLKGGMKGQELIGARKFMVLNK